jgi:hypothetical protein
VAELPSSAPSAPATTKVVEGQPCLRRDATNDGKCAGNPRPHYFTWDEHACAVAQETVREVAKRCDAIGPHRGMNILNWCCP